MHLPSLPQAVPACTFFKISGKGLHKYYPNRSTPKGSLKLVRGPQNPTEDNNFETQQQIVFAPLQFLLYLVQTTRTTSRTLFDPVTANFHPAQASTHQHHEMTPRAHLFHFHLTFNSSQILPSLLQLVPENHPRGTRRHRKMNDNQLFSPLSLAHHLSRSQNAISHHLPTEQTVPLDLVIATNEPSQNKANEADNHPWNLPIHHSLSLPRWPSQPRN